MKILVLLSVGVLLGVVSSNLSQDKKQEKPKMQYVFDFGELEAKRDESKRPWLQFLNVDSMYLGVYSLAAGAKDGQQPHAQDEIYFVQEGKAKISIDGEDFELKPGSVVFVPAHLPHRFHSITQDLKTLVFFSKVPVKKDTD